MTVWSMPITVEMATGSGCLNEPDSSLWFGTTVRQVMTYRLLDGEVRLRGGGYDESVSVSRIKDGLGVLVAQQNGRICFQTVMPNNYRRAARLPAPGTSAHEQQQRLSQIFSAQRLTHQIRD